MLLKFQGGTTCLALLDYLSNADVNVDVELMSY